MIIAIDFDGTLHDGEYPHIGNPKDHVQQVMQQLINDGHYLILWTCRHGDLLTDAINWLLSNNIPINRINAQNPANVEKYGDNTRKVYAHLYIDDKQVGDLPDWQTIYMYIRKKDEAYQQLKK